MKRFTLLLFYTMLFAISAYASDIDSLYWEDFSNVENNGKGAQGDGNTATNDIVYDLPVGGEWTVDATGANMVMATDYFRQASSMFVGCDLEGDPDVSWSTQEIDISTVAKVSIFVDLMFGGSFETGDYTKVYYVLDNGAEVEIANIEGSDGSTPADVTATIDGISGSTLKVVIRCTNNSATEFNKFDNVLVVEEGEAVVDVTDVILDHQSLEMKTNNTASLIATVLPANATNQLLTWQSLDESVVTVENGQLTALAVGTTKVIVSADGGTDVKDTCDVTVVKNDILYLEDFSNVENNGKGAQGDGNTGTNDIVYDLPVGGEWTVDATGANMVMSTDYFRQASSMFVGCDLEGDPDVSWSTMEIDISSVISVSIFVDLMFGGTFETGDYTKVYYVLDNGAEVEIANIEGSDGSTPADSTVTIGGVSGSTLKVVIRCTNNSATEFNKFDNVMVVEEEEAIVDVTDVVLDHQSLEIKTNNTASLTATVLPANAANTSLTWLSLDESVVTVENGLLTALAVGTTKVIVSADGGTDVRDTCDVTVIQNDTLYIEDFSNVENNGKGAQGDGNTATNDIVYDLPVGGEWTVDATGANLVMATDYFRQATSMFVGCDLEGSPDVSWSTMEIDISIVNKVRIFVDLMFAGTFETGDYTKVYYVLDNGAEVEIANIEGSDGSTPADSTVTMGGVSGSTLKLIIKCTNNSKDEYNKFDNVLVVEDTEVIVDVTDVILDHQSLEMKTNKTASLTATVLPANATSKLLTWLSLDESVVAVENGQLTALAVGTAKVIVSADGGTDVRDTCDVTVVQNDTLYLEDFSNQANNDKGVTGDGVADTYDLIYNQPDGGEWTVDASGAKMELTTDYFKQHGNSQTFLTRNVNGSPDAKWVSKDIDITIYPQVKLSIDFLFAGNFETDDYVKALYVIDHGTDTIEVDNIYGRGSVDGDDISLPLDTTLLANWIVGSTLNVVVRCTNNSVEEYMKFDNIVVAEDTSTKPPIIYVESLNRNTANITVLRDQLRISTNTKQLLRVYNITGALVMSEMIYEGESYVTLPKGLYIATLRSNEGILSKKVLMH